MKRSFLIGQLAVFTPHRLSWISKANFDLTLWKTALIHTRKNKRRHPGSPVIAKSIQRNYYTKKTSSRVSGPTKRPLQIVDKGLISIEARVLFSSGTPSNGSVNYARSLNVQLWNRTALNRTLAWFVLNIHGLCERFNWTNHEPLEVLVSQRSHQYSSFRAEIFSI